MVEQLKQFLATPTFANEEENRIAGILNVILRTLVIVGILMSLIMFVFGHQLTTTILVVTLLVLFVCYGLMRRGHLRIVSIVVLLVLTLMVIVILYAGFGVHDPAIMMLPMIIIIAGLILDAWLFAAFTGLSVLVVGMIILMEVNGYVDDAIFTRDSKALEFVIYSAILVITAVTVRLLTQSLKDNLARARKSEAQWKSLVKNAPDLIFYLQKDGTIEFMNTVIDRLDMDVVGHTIFEFTHPDYHEQVREAIDQVLTTGEKASYETLGLGQSGNDWFANRLGVVKEAGTITGLMMISTNITERREMDIALKAERDFAQSIITNMGQGLIVIGESNQFVYVNPAFTRMTGYNIEMLAGKTPFDIVVSENVGQLEEESMRQRAGQASSFATRVQHVDGHIVHVFITGVPRWQEDKFIGSVAVITDLSEQIGMGIDPKYHEKVFGLFERLDSSIEGTGIGLALVKRIVEVHNGRLWVESAGKGQGATFYFTLPLVAGETSS